ncbi:MAG: SLC13 family permease [Candidatus Hodarchaeota archaeon]
MDKQSFLFLGAVSVVSVMAALSGLNSDQVFSMTILSVIIGGAIFFWKYRVAFAFIGVAGLLAFGLIDIPHLIEFAGLDIILFLVSMMIIIGFLEERGFFEYLIDKIIHHVGPDGKKLTLVMMFMAALFAALVDEVTSILFMTAAVFHLVGRYKLNPIPFVIMIVFATNIGSSATVVGNPVGVIIALKAELTFIDFLRWATPISFLALILTILICMRYFAEDIKKLDECIKASDLEANKKEEEEGEKERDGGTEGEVGHDYVEVRILISGRNLKICWSLFLGTIFALVMHSFIEKILDLEKNSMLLGVAMIAAGLALMIEREGARELVEKRVDWWTLTFFLLLFASVGTLAFVGTTEVIADWLLSLSGENELLLFFIFMIIACLLSALIDNVLAVATLVPIIYALSAEGVDVFPFWWGMLFAGTFFGNLTMIGSTANIVAIGMIERRKMGHITFKDWVKPGVLVSVPTILLAIFLIYIQMPIMPEW